MNIARTSKWYSTYAGTEIRVSPALNIRTSLRLRDMRFWTAAVGAATYFFKLMSDQLNAEECNIRRFCRMCTPPPGATLLSRWPLRMRGCNVECNNCTGKPLWCQCINPVRASAAATHPLLGLLRLFLFVSPVLLGNLSRTPPFLAVEAWIRIFENSDRLVIRRSCTKLARILLIRRWLR